MKTIAIDTNVLLDYRFQREPHSLQINQLFQDLLAEKIEVFIPGIVFLEIEWVLRSYYKQPKDQISSFLGDLLALPGVKVDGSKEIQLALYTFKTTNINLTDALILAQVQRHPVDEFLTFDLDLQKIYKKSLNKS